MSISVFICRDYLVPYDEQHRSLLDWERPGLNLVIMLSPQTELFEAQAGLDVRRLRGKGRFVGLCNCAATNPSASEFTGTALLGPTKDSRRKRGDLIERLPSNKEAILTAELDLRDVRYVQTRPARTEHDPLGAVRRYSIVREVEHRILFDPIVDASSSERGVWHPALLDVLGRNITLIFRKSRRYREVANALRDPSHKKIRFVSVAGVIGEHDLLFRLYKDTAEKLSLAGNPYSSMPQAEQDRLFDQVPQKFIVEPKYIYKYRTNIVPPDQTLWDIKKKEIKSIIPMWPNRRRRRTMLSVLCRLARDWNDNQVSPEIKELAQSCFLGGVETVPRIGPNSGNSLRRRYILVSLSHFAPQFIDTFERHIIRSWLVSLSEVRSLYRLQTKSEFTQFHFWIDLIADPFDADALLLELQRRCEEERLEIGTRSIDVMEELLHESIEGIENTDYGEGTCRFLQEIPPVELDTAILLENEQFLFNWAGAWEVQTASIDPKLAPSTSGYLTEFYTCLFCGNFGLSKSERRKFVRDAASAWFKIYQDLETASRQYLVKLVGTNDDQRELDRSLASHFANKPALLNECRGDWVRLLLEYMDTCRPELSLPATDDMKAVRRQTNDLLRPFRNDMTHEGDPRKMAALDILGMQLDQRTLNAAKVTDATKALVDLLNAILEASRS